MKFFTIGLFFILSSQLFAQTSIPKLVINDYATASYGEYKYGNGNLRAMMQLRLRVFGYDRISVEVQMEKLGIDSKFLNATFQVWYNEFQSKERLFENLASIGMKASNAEILADYIINKYAPKEPSDAEKKATVGKAYIDYINQYISGKKAIRGESIDLSDISDIDLLNVDSKLKVKSNIGNVKCNADSLIQFLPKFFSNESYYLIISKEGRLTGLVNEDGGTKLLVSEYPFLSSWITFDGKAQLMYNSKAYPVTYEAPGLKISHRECVNTTQYFFSIGNKELQEVKDSILFSSRVTRDEYDEHSRCGFSLQFKFDKEVLQKELFAQLDISDYKELKHRTNTTSKTGSNLLKSGLLTIATGVPTLAESKELQVVYRFVKSRQSSITNLEDLRSGRLIKQVKIDEEKPDARVEQYNYRTKIFDLLR